MNSGKKSVKPDLQALCQQVGARFGSEIESAERAFLHTGISGARLPRYQLSEIIETGPSAGGNLLLHILLGSIRREGGYVALVDGMDAFAPEAAEAPDLTHLYWVACRSTEDALRAAELLVADANFRLLLIDLRRNDPLSLRRVPPTRWVRLQRRLEKTACSCVGLTSRPLISAARTRFLLDRPFALSDLEEPRSELCRKLSLEPLSIAAPFARLG